MSTIDQSGLAGKIRDRPIGKKLYSVLQRAGKAAGIDTICITSGCQPGTSGRTTGSTRHNGGRAADLHLVVNGKKLAFSDTSAPAAVKKFITACAAYGASGMGAGVKYMGRSTLHIGFGKTKRDTAKLVWGAKGRSANSPKWLRDAAREGWNNPPSWVFDTDSDKPEDLPEDEDSIKHVSQTEFGSIPSKFNREVIKGAQASQRKWNVPASVTLAQWALESDYGRRMPAGSNNPFGIKALAGQPSVNARTTEVLKGKKVRVTEPFRVFPTMEAAFIKHGKLLGTSKYYKRARQFSGDADKFADALTGIYATDPRYGSKLKSIMKSNNLYKFNVTGSADVLIGGTERDTEMSNTISQGHPDMVAVAALQQRLTSLGYKLGKIDGKFGNLTASALLAFQNENDLPTTGVVDDVTQAALSTAKPRRLSSERESVTEKELALGGSRTMINARRSRFMSWVVGALGALGVGNSAVVNSAGTVAGQAQQALPEQLLPLLGQVQLLSPNSKVEEFNAVTATAKSLAAQLNGTGVPLEAAKLLSQLQSVLPPEVLAANPDLAKILSTLIKTPVGQGSPMQTIFDVLPSIFANGSILETVANGVAAVGSSVLPGFGGSLGMLAVGVAGRWLANRIADARLNDHKTAGNINALK